MIIDVLLYRFDIVFKIQLNNPKILIMIVVLLRYEK